MKNFVNTYYQNHSLIYKILLFVVITAAIVYLFPKGGQFKYNIQKGKPWAYENLYAPFDFAILKSEEDLAAEREEIEANKQLFFSIKEGVPEKVEEKYDVQILLVLEDSAAARINKNSIKKFGKRFLDRVYSEYLNCQWGV